MKRVEITGPAEDVIDHLISTGRCKDAEEAVNVSLGLLKDMDAKKIQELRDDIALGLEDIENGNIGRPECVEETKRNFRERRKQEHTN